jgi:hypothetical protein
MIPRFTASLIMKPLVIRDYMLFSQSFILALNTREDTKNIASLAV